MSFHGLFKLHFRSAGVEGQESVQCVKLEIIPVSTAGRTRSAVADAAKVIGALPGSIFKRFVRGNAFGELTGFGGGYYR